MTGRQLYNYLFTSAPGSYEVYAAIPGRGAGLFYVKSIDVGEDGVRVVVSDVTAGRQSDWPMTAGRALSALHTGLDRAQMDFDVLVKVARRSYWTSPSVILQSVAVIPCYRGRALCLVTR